MQRELWAAICAAGMLSGEILAQQPAATEIPGTDAITVPSLLTPPVLQPSGETGGPAESQPGQQSAGSGQEVTNLQLTPSPQTPPSLLMMALQGTCAGDLLSSQRIRVYGWVDEGYTYSTSGPGRLSVEPLPNRFGDEFTFNQVTFVVERPLDPKELSWGFVFRTYAGADAALLAPIRGTIIPNPHPRFGFDVGTALLQAHLPVLTEGGVDVEVGQHLPIIGYEAALPTLRNIYSNDYQFFYGLPGVATGVFVTTHVNQQLDVEGAVTLGTPVFFKSVSVAPVYMGVVSYWLEEDRKTQISPAVVIGPFNPQSNVYTTTETVTRNWNRYLTQAVQFYGCYSNSGILVPGLERAYGL
jgi:Putative beta-barrel porin-2, OmpL-like. bbp2